MLLSRYRLFNLVLIVLFVSIALTGCVPNQDMTKKLDPNSVWDKFLVIPLTDLLDWFKGVLGNYGWSILVVTFLVRLALFPFTWKQQQSMNAMKELQPHMMKIREKHKNNAQKLNEETLKLYQENNVNPMAGCLTMIIQIPIMFAFYQAIMYNTHISKSAFLYMQLGKYDPYYILPFLAAVTTYLQFVITGAGDNPQTKVMLWVMPIMIFVIGYQLPSALSLYWVYGNIFTILQYVFFFKTKKETLAKPESVR